MQNKRGQEPLRRIGEKLINSTFSEVKAPRVETGSEKTNKIKEGERKSASLLTTLKPIFAAGYL